MEIDYKARCAELEADLADMAARMVAPAADPDRALRDECAWDLLFHWIKEHGLVDLEKHAAQALTAADAFIAARGGTNA